MEKIVGGLKAQGPGKALVWLLAAAALSVPDFSRATAYVVSLPDAAYPFPVLLGALAALYAMFANRLPRCRGALAAALLVACLAFELACAFMQRTLADWNYLSVNAGFTAIGRALRILALCALLSWSGGGEGLSDGARRRAAACLGASGALCALALRCLGELGCAREETLAASVAGWAYLAVLSALSTARGFEVGMPLANGVFAFLVGAFIGTDAATVACGSATAAAEASWALPASFALAVASLVLLALPRGRDVQAASACGEGRRDAAGEGVRTASRLDAIPGAEGLSSREAQVAAAELAGASDADIADELGVKPQTVSTYRSRMYQKLGVSSRAELLEAARSCAGMPGQAMQVAGPRASAMPLSWSAVAFRAGLGAAALLLLAALLRSAVPLPAQRHALLAVSVLLILKGASGLVRAQGQEGLGRGRGSCPGFEPQFVAGCACACVGAVVSPQLPTLSGWRALAAPAATFLSLVWVFGAARDGSARALTAMTCGVAGLLTVQAGPYGLQTAEPWPQLALPLVGLLAVATLGIDRRLAEKELSDAVLVGETRCKSYLRGRGLSELEAGVLILSAKKMGRAAIAESLAISVATVSAYRARGARKLGAESLDEAFRLMREEGGLDKA